MKVYSFGFKYTPCYTYSIVLKDIVNQKSLKKRDPKQSCADKNKT